MGETVLYYGCRHEREDYLYREELARFQKEGVLTQLNVAFSRDQAEKVPPCSPCHLFLLPTIPPMAGRRAPSTSPVSQSHEHSLGFPPSLSTACGVGALLLSPHSHLVSCQVYVQHLLKKNKENVWKLIDEGMAHIYVCG